MQSETIYIGGILKVVLPVYQPLLPQEDKTNSLMISQSANTDIACYPPGEGPYMHAGMPCSNAVEIREDEARVWDSWKRFVARGYKN
jgi:hypothetical protein